MDRSLNDDHDSKYWSDEKEKLILEPYSYLLKNSGKGFRQQLSIAFNHWLRIPSDKLDTINEVIDMLHNSSLLIDDIEDSSLLRRGSPTAQMIYGIPITLNCGNYVYFLALQKCLSLNHLLAPSIFSKQMLNLHRGQGMDIYWRDTFTCPTIEEYKGMIIQKTGGLFGLAIQLMQLFSDDQRDFNSLLDNLGLLFQVRDDLANLIDETYHSKKTFAEDLTEGKFSYPIIAAVHKDPSDHQVLSILRQRTSNLSVKQHCIDVIKSMGILDETADFCIESETKCARAIADLGGNPHLTELLARYSTLYREFRSKSGDNN